MVANATMFSHLLPGLNLFSKISKIHDKQAMIEHACNLTKDDTLKHTNVGLHLFPMWSLKYGAQVVANICYCHKVLVLLI